MRTIVITLPRSLNDEAADTLRDNVYEAIRAAENHVALDGANVEDISPAGVGVLVAAALLAQSAGSSLQIQRPSSPLRRLLARHQHVAEILDVSR